MPRPQVVPVSTNTGPGRAARRQRLIAKGIRTRKPHPTARQQIGQSGRRVAGLASHSALRDGRSGLGEKAPLDPVPETGSRGHAENQADDHRAAAAVKAGRRVLVRATDLVDRVADRDRGNRAVAELRD